MTRPVPTTAEFIDANAALHPGRLALREEGTELTYGQLQCIVVQAGLALQRLGVQRGQRVAVSGPGFGIQLVLLLAAESLGAVTVSFQADNDPDAGWLLPRVDWVFSGLPQALPEGVRFVPLDAEFARRLGEPLREPPPAWTPLPAGEPQRMVRTSGSSGISKFMLLAREQQEWWIRVSLEAPGWSMDPGTRILALAPLVVNAAYVRVSGALRRGGTVVIGPGRDIEALAPTHISGLPVHVERLLADVPAGWRSPRPVSVSTFGGPATPALRARCEAVFGTAMRNGYGSNETGTVCDNLDASGTGVVRAGMDVRVLDEEGRELPPGSTGIIALRTPALAQGYLERPEESARAFRDGWFISGDVGALVGPRLLRIAGRHDDLVNVGGLKVPARQLEAALTAQPAIEDAAVMAVHLERGAMTLGVALVLAPGTSAADAGEQVRAALQLPANLEARVLHVQALPRVASGKVDRMALMRLFQG